MQPNIRSAAGLKTRKFSFLSATMTASPMSDKIEWRISFVRESSAVRSEIACSNWLRLSRRACSSSRCSVTSVLVPNQRTTRPSASVMGSARERNHRYSPSLLRSGKVSSHGSPVAKATLMRSTTRSTSCGWCIFCQPHPCISSSVVPVYSYHRSLYQKM